MSQLRARMLMVLCGMCSVVAAFAPLAGAATRQQVPQAPEQFARGGSEAIDYLADCVGSDNRLLAQFLVDESGSLDDTDTAGRRVDALKVAIRSLESIRAGDPDENTKIDVAITAFAQKFTDARFSQRDDDDDAGQVEWTTLGGGAADAQVAVAESFRSRNNGFDTDYYLALAGAQSAFAQRSAALAENGEATPCKVLFWFTDGEYDIVDRLRPGEIDTFGATKPYSDVQLGRPDSGEAVESDGVNALCAAGGPIDQLRADGVVIAPFALTTGMDPGDEAFLLRAAGVDGTPCGERTPADGSAPGLYFGSTEVGDVIAAFDALANQLANGNPAGGTPVPVCSLGNVTDECVERFEVDRIFSRFHILALTGGESIRVELRAPGDGAPVTMDPTDRGTGSLAGANVRWVWVAPDAVQIDVDLPDEPGDWVGEWSVTFVDFAGENPSAIARANVHLFGDFDLALTEEPSLRRGESGEFEGRIQRREGTPVNEDLFEQLGLRGFITDPQTGDRTEVQIESPEADGTFRGTVDVPASITSSSANLTLQLEPVTEEGIALKPEPQTFSVGVLPPQRYPRIVPDTFDLPGVEARGTTSVTFRVIASDQAGGSVWVEGVDFDESSNPVEGVTARFSPEMRDRTTAIRVEAGGETTVTLEIEPSDQGEGTMHGVVRFALTADGDQEVAPLEVPVRFTMSIPVDDRIRWLLVALLMLLSLLVMAAIMYFANWLTARFASPGVLRYADLDVEVGDGALRRADSRGAGTDLQLTADDFRQLVRDCGSPSSFQQSGIQFRARLHPSPFHRPVASAGLVGAAQPATSGSLLLTNDGAAVPTGRGRWRRAGRTAPTRLVLRRQWVFRGSAVDKAGVQHGRLLVFVQIGDAVRDIQRVQVSLDDLPARVASYRAARAGDRGDEGEQPGETPSGRPGPPRRRPGGSGAAGAGAGGGRPKRPGRRATGTSDSQRRSQAGPPGSDRPPPRPSGTRARGSESEAPRRPGSRSRRGPSDDPTEPEPNRRRPRRSGP